MAAVCPVCGFSGLEEEPRTVEGGGSYEICPSCGFQFGLDDDAGPQMYAIWRKHWIDRGMVWWSPDGHGKPADWDPVRQVALVRDTGTGARD